jgi:oligosaccharide repeat unit polymerase
VTEFIVAIPVFVGLVGVATYIKSGRLLNPINLICVWWGSWLFIANLSPTGIRIPGAYTQGLYLMLLGSIAYGGMCVPFRRGIARDDPEDQYMLLKWRWMLIALLAVSPMIIYHFYKAMTSYILGGELISRAAIFGVEGGSILFGSPMVQQFYHYAVRPVLFAGLISGISIYACHRKKSIILLASILMLMDAVMMMGRKTIYVTIVLMIATFFFYSRKGMSKIRGYILLFVFMLSTIVIGVTAWRLGGAVSQKVIAERYLVQYHTSGFAVFDKQVNDPTSRLRTEITYGRGALGGIDQVIAIVLRRVEGSFRSVSRETGQVMNRYRKIGYGDGGVIEMNAFNTILYTLYLDGRELFILIFGFLYGFFIMFQYNKFVKNKRFKNLIYINMLTYIGVMGIFNSPLEGSTTALMFLIVLVLDKIKLPIPVVESGNTAIG